MEKIKDRWPFESGITLRDLRRGFLLYGTVTLTVIVCSLPWAIMRAFFHFNSPIVFCLTIVISLIIGNHFWRKLEKKMYNKLRDGEAVNSTGS